MTKRIILTALVLLGIAAAVAAAPGEHLVAIDIVIEPDQTMIDTATALDARLRTDDPAGFGLDGTHAPHVSLLQRFIRTSDLDAVEAAVTKVLIVERATDLRLKATGIDYAMWAGSAVTVFVMERTPELMRLQQKVADGVEPLVPKSSGANYLPHVTVGVAHEAFAKRLKAEPFTAFSATTRGVAIYQLGNFGTAAKRLWEQAAVPSQH